MVHQSTFIHCTEITFGALEIKKQSLSSMSRLHMFGQIFLLTKIFFAIRTSKYLPSRTITLHVVFYIVHCETLEIAILYIPSNIRFQQYHAAQTSNLSILNMYSRSHFYFNCQISMLIYLSTQSLDLIY